MRWSHHIPVGTSMSAALHAAQDRGGGVLFIKETGVEVTILSNEGPNQEEVRTYTIKGRVYHALYR